MNKKISITVVLTIATILTAYISAVSLSNQAFAQSTTPQNRQSQSLQSTQAHVGQVLGGKPIQDLTAGHVLGGHQHGLGFNPATGEPFGFGAFLKK
jgi:hypothetical protein